jgi:cell division protein ZapA (FtsZ GTPase activity inhibitor)
MTGNDRPGRACAAQSEDDMVNKVRVTIAGAPYAIATTDTENYITTLAKKLDDDITKLLDNNANLSVTKAAVFCAMDYLSSICSPHSFARREFQISSSNSSSFSPMGRFKYFSVSVFMHAIT